MQRFLGWGDDRRRRNDRLASALSPRFAGRFDSTQIAEMTNPNSVDIAFITFNCAKEFVVPDTFGTHLSKTLAKTGSTDQLPELLVLSLQEISPLPHAFLGGSYLKLYFDKFATAVDIAASKFNSENRVFHKESYTLVKAANVGMTAVMLFAIDPLCVENLQVAETSFGTSDMGNKGSVGLRFLYATASEGGDDVSGLVAHRRETEMTFVAAHFAAMEWNLRVRNQNWRSVMSSLLFDNPESILPAQTGSSGTSGSVEAQPLLVGDNSHVNPAVERDEVESQLAALTPADQKRLHNSTIFKPSSHVFIAGDLNYRISEESPESGAKFPSLNPDSEHYHPQFFAKRDQLTNEMSRGRALHGMQEAPVSFPPTYKYTILPEGDQDASPECNTDADGNRDSREPDKVWWKFAEHRWPSWCDRVLFRDVSAAGQEQGMDSIRVSAYDAMPVVKTSDHRPVILRVTVPLIEPEKLAGSARVADPNAQPQPAPGTNVVDTRIKLPVAVARDAWERRRTARKKEVAVGSTTIGWYSREGPMVVAGTLALVAAAYYIGTYYFG
ncbi:DNase I-like protein [Zalerion maritima]|uniref:DNase I-like protein n=1 Tax=Zalerion maritima TaxID=339359 RepID=A0AAD5RJ95_9PEZI|nr:DNase I-like protein [Zalerion maritima]